MNTVELVGAVAHGPFTTEGKSCNVTRISVKVDPEGGAKYPSYINCVCFEPINPYKEKSVFRFAKDYIKPGFPVHVKGYLNTSKDKNGNYTTEVVIVGIETRNGVYNMDAEDCVFA